MKLTYKDDLPPLKQSRIVIIGHVEWVTFLEVDLLPIAGNISHAKKILEEPAGGGAVIAVKLARLLGKRIDFITALGNDSIGEKSFKRLTELGLNVHVSWRAQSTRKGISMIDSKGDRAITVIGERLEPKLTDNLQWSELLNCDGIFITAADTSLVKKCREVQFLGTTPRLGIAKIREANIKLDLIVGSDLDKDEKLIGNEFQLTPKLRIGTRGKSGGESWPGGKFSCLNIIEPAIDSYGCGDSFAAGVTAGLVSGWENHEAISLGSFMGEKAASSFGPY